MAESVRTRGAKNSHLGEKSNFPAVSSMRNRNGDLLGGDSDVSRGSSGVQATSDWPLKIIFPEKKYSPVHKGCKCV